MVAADLERPETLPAALDGAERVFLYAKPDGIDGFVAAAQSAGVRHIVLLSSGAVLSDTSEHNPIARMHSAVESAITESGLEWTFLRPGMFATNALWWWQHSIRTRGVAYATDPESRTAPIHEKDLAALAITTLTESGHHGQAYPVWGVEALTLRQQVHRIAEAIGREIAFEPVTVDEARARLSETMPAYGIEPVLAGWAAGTTHPPNVSAIVEEVTGQPGRSFTQWATDHADDFR
jgi:uncharacterized protein YbjT (DUF2867 family)